MPFFTGAQDFKINGGEMNDVSGNYTKNVQTATTNNHDSFNNTTNSTVSQGNTTNQSATHTGGNVSQKAS